MKFEIPLDGGRGVIGIAILASIQATIVNADINAGHTAAFFPLILILGQRQGLADDSFQQVTVDAMTVADAKPGQINGLCAGFQRKVVLPGDIRKAACQLVNFGLSKGSKLLAQMTVQIYKANDTFIGVTGEPLRQFLEVMDMICCGVLGCQNDGIIPPDNSLWANLLGEVLKSWDDYIVFAGDTCFQILAVGIQGELKVKWVAVQQVKLVQHGGGVLRPKHDAVHHIRGKRNAADLFGIHRIAGADKAGFQTAKEPVGIV